MEKSFENKILNGTIIIVAVGIVAKFASFISEAVLAADSAAAAAPAPHAKDAPHDMF